MKTLLAAALLCAAAARAQDLSVVIHDPTGNVADQPLPASYQFLATPVGGGNSIVLRITNTSGWPMQIATVLVGSSSGSSTLSPDFTVTGVAVAKTLAPSSGFEDVTLNFNPTTTGTLTGYLQAFYQVQKNGCDLASNNPNTQCTAQSAALSTVQGSATAPQTLLSYNGTVLYPNATAPLNFGNVSTSATSSITFNISNQSASTIAAPSVSIQAFGSSAFNLDTSALPASIPAGSSGSFTVTFAPGQTGLTTATLVVGSLQYPISGTGVVFADIDALQISYTDSTGVRTLPQAATPINFGNAIAGTTTPKTLAFTVTNPVTALNAVTLQTIATTGAGFSLSGVPGMPVTISPGQSITFQAAFSPGATGTYTGALAIGTRQFSLTAKSINSLLPDASFVLDVQPVTSQHQVHLTIQLAATSTIDAIGQLAMTFTPSVANVADDPAVMFVSTGGRQTQVNVAAGSQSATFNGQPAITFQSGTTAGTLTLTLTFPDKAPLTQSFTIAPQTVQITSATAVRQNPNLVVTLTGFDNTYSAGKLSFNFYDSGGKLLSPSPIDVDASNAFHQYFFVNNQAGGAFSLQASFPVTGDINQIGSVAVNLSNSVGPTPKSQNFQ
ncbi:MAG: choice-of-anchor D domain-containing protein [Acidobacteriaceae bacterium]|nr:choice-of-anchor D domain-containing protein [Acidobacteriaceae bacterium]